MWKTSPFLLGVRRSLYGGLVGGHEAFFFCASLKRTWNVPNAFPRSSHSWEREAGSCPSFPGSDMWKKMTPPDQQSGFPASHREPWEVSSRSAEWDPGLADTLPSLLWAIASVSWSSALISSPPLSLRVCWRQRGCFTLSFCSLRACLLAFKEFKGWLPRSILRASICFLYSALEGSSHWLYILVPFPALPFVESSQETLPGGVFLGLGMALLLQKQTSWDIFYFTSQLEKAQLNKPTYKKDENKATKSPGYLKNNEK